MFEEQSPQKWNGMEKELLVYGHGTECWYFSLIMQKLFPLSEQIAEMNE